jgi:hypothetical protein
MYSYLYLYLGMRPSRVSRPPALSTFSELRHFWNSKQAGVTRG